MSDVSIIHFHQMKNYIEGTFRFLYADPTPNALQVFLSEKDMDDAANTPIRSSSGQGLAPSAASAMMEDVISTTAATDVEMSDLPDEEGTERGVWITADPKPGCVVCNIGESKSRQISLTKLDLMK